MYKSTVDSVLIYQFIGVLCIFVFSVLSDLVYGQLMPALPQVEVLAPLVIPPNLGKDKSCKVVKLSR